MVDVKAQLTATMWKVLASVGDEVEEDDELAILESMKMEIPVESPVDGKVVEVLIKEGDAVAQGQVLMRLEED